MYRPFYKLLLLIAWLLLSVQGHAATDSSTLYSDVENSVFQVRVINKQTGKKTTIGSGFVVSENNLIATNYHVVSSYVNDPDEYTLDYLSTSGKTGSLELLTVDVIHDLAVLRADTSLGPPLSIAKIPPKGARLFSLGNPLDLGFSIVEGTNNGLMKYSDDDNILFSGSLNPGMSGGPSLTEDGGVVGINVATSGNEVSFLVPAQYLGSMLERLKLTGFTPDDDIPERISEQLLGNTEKYLKHLQTAKWDTLKIGNYTVPGDIEGSTRCWDNSDKPDPDEMLRMYYTRCSNENSIYLDDGLEVGQVAYEYIWLEGDKLLPARFYRRYERLNSSSPEGDADKGDVTNFNCFTGFPNVSGQEFKMTVCRRDYLHYKGLSDVLVTGALAGFKQQGMFFNLDLNGVDFDAAMRLLKRMLEGFKWQN